MTILQFNIALALIALIAGFMAIGGETWKKNEPKYSKRLTWRGWLSCVLLVATAAVTGLREREIKISHEAENKQLVENMNTLQNDIKESGNARFTAEMRQQGLMEQLIELTTARKDTLIAEQKDKIKPVQPTSSEIAAMKNTIKQYKEELQAVSKSLSAFSERKSLNETSIQPERQSKEFPVPASDGHLKIFADSYHIQKKEAFIFHVDRLSNGTWQPLFPSEVHIETTGKWYSIDGGSFPQFGLKGKGNITLQITDVIKGGSKKCTVFFED